ncbi:DUF4336 domain-containing protein [Aestuariirhabdus sp. Z084]|uniref:DUF4336 domain-containing protein n=1 Tax=Aestuariirhabdus haliotis TaxID=2918751 RepID=UPI00201B42B3|nr:DUF4336 domain-containing protein [Aestuariirhabdus haliotis]MCL6417635.1 DUF4336 domain-containing protein [Aestuariirhabdus haliotis]MCL6421561.1 DUF4336 domain-containing protein [Aestuariirhabdus haliotis]
MNQLSDGLWIHDDIMSLLGVPLRVRMTIVRLSSGGLWVHSPTRLLPELASEVESLGAVEYLVGPNNGHNLWLDEWHQAYPEAALYVSPGIPAKIRSNQYRLLGASPVLAWKKDLEQVHIQGAPFFDETVFFHPRTGSLIVTDLIQHYDARPPGLAGLITRWVLEPMGFKGICLAPPLKRKFILKDKLAFSAAIDRIAQWDFERIIIAHGDIIESRAKEIFVQLCDGLLGSNHDCHQSLESYRLKQ